MKNFTVVIGKDEDTIIPKQPLTTIVFGLYEVGDPRISKGELVYVGDAFGVVLHF